MQEFGRRELEQLLLDFERVLAGPEAGAVGDAEDVRVHRHGRLAEGGVQHHVGGLAADAGQAFQFFAGSGYFAVVILHQQT